MPTKRKRESAKPDDPPRLRDAECCIHCIYGLFEAYEHYGFCRKYRGSMIYTETVCDVYKSRSDKCKIRS